MDILIMNKFNTLYKRIISQEYDGPITNIYDQDDAVIIMSPITNRHAEQIYKIIEQQYHLKDYNSNQIFYWLAKIVLTNWSKELNKSNLRKLECFWKWYQDEYGRNDCDLVKITDEEQGRNVPDYLNDYFIDLGLNRYTNEQIQ